jgi:hypothetical protein
MKKSFLIFAFIGFLSLAAFAQPQLSWQLANFEIQNAGAELHFDVQVKADASGTYHRDLQVYLDYNTAGFGSSIVSGGHVTVTPGPLMDNYYSVVNTVDNTASKLAIITEGDNEFTSVGSAANFNLMADTYTTLFSVSMDISDNTVLSGISFDEALMNGGQYYQNTAVVEPIKYANPSVYANDFLNLKLSSAYGTITYANATNQVLDNCTLNLISGGSVIATTSTDAAGYYSFNSVADGSYTIEVTCSNARGGNDVLDLNLVRDYILGSAVLSPLQFLASDVNVDTNADILDYNLMRDVILGSAAGWAAPDYVFVIQNITVNNGLGSVSFQGLSSGDPDGSYTW